MFSERIRRRQETWWGSGKSLGSRLHRLRELAARRAIDEPLGRGRCCSLWRRTERIGSRVCFVTCRTWPDVSESDRLVQRALERRGVAVQARPWNGADLRFDDFDAVIFRSNWDYHHAPDQFLDWLARWEAAGVRFWNEPALIRWNLVVLGIHRAVAAFSPAPRRREPLPRWAGTLGLVLGSVLGAGACSGLALLF